MRVRNPIVAVAAATAWIAFSEFIRNEYLLKSYWVQHYSSLGLVYPSSATNGAVWGIWSLVFAAVIVALSRRLSTLNTIVISWATGFLMMWLVIGNLGVLPLRILPYALPLSILEAGVATLIVTRFNSSRQQT